MPSTWTAPATADVLSEFTPAEIAAIKRLQDDADGSNLTAILGRVVAKWRGAIRSGGYAVDSDATKLPLEVHDDVVAMTRWRYIIACRTGGTAMQTKERREANEAAKTKCDLIAAGKCPVEPPVLDEESVGRAGTWNSENKLLGRGHPIPRPGTQTSGAGRYANPDAPADTGQDA